MSTGAQMDFAKTPEKAYENSGNPALLSLLPPLAGKAVLDLGCGTGAHMRAFQREGASVVGVTLSPVEARSGRAAGLDIVLADLTRQLPFVSAGRFDLVVLSHVLEHCADPGALLRAARNLLTANGLIALAVPSVTHYPVRLRLLRGDWTYGDTGILDWTHLRFFSLPGIRAVIHREGVRIVAERHDGALPYWLLRGVLPGRLVAALNRLATRHSPELFANQFVFLLQ